MDPLGRLLFWGAAIVAFAVWVVLVRYGIVPVAAGR
jgi:hypothetical protein